MNENQVKETSAPCIDCEDRYVGCHGACEKYGTWKAAHLEAKRREYDKRRSDYMFDGYRVERNDRVRRRNPRRKRNEKR